MGAKTGIAWTDATWNPVAGCTRVSEGCRKCYAERATYRLGQRLGIKKYAGLVTLRGGEPHWTGELRLWEPHLDQPLRWKKPRRVFVNSMSDLFHEAMPDAWIDRVVKIMVQAPQHSFQVLTKRPERMRDYLRARPVLVNVDTNQHVPWPAPHIWWGVSVEDQATANARIPVLLEMPALVRWVSYEPALAAVDFSRWIAGQPRVNWIVVGGESGSQARPFHLNWARDVIVQANAAAVFVKQMGAHPHDDVAGRTYCLSAAWLQSSCGAGSWSRSRAFKHRAGADPSEWPESLRVQEYPA